MPVSWWLVLRMTVVQYTDAYNTGPQQNVTVYSWGGPVAPTFCTRAPNCQIITVSFTNWHFSVSWLLGIVGIVPSPLWQRTVHRWQLGAPAWGPRRYIPRLRPRQVWRSIQQN